MKTEPQNQAGERTQHTPWHLVDIGDALKKATKKQITGTKMDRAERMGDWHDKPLRWIVGGPGGVQKFSTKKDATRFASIYRKSDSLTQAMATYTRLPY